MFMASNQFKVIKGQEEEFEEMWGARRSRLHEAPGFVGFRFQKGKENGDHVLYMSLTMWETEEHFLAWRYFEQFREGHNFSEQNRSRRVGLSRIEEFEAMFSTNNPQ